MWLIAEYEATTLFTLKAATATASGGRTLLVPTPFALKMALLDIACRLEGQDEAAAVWDGWLGKLSVALRPPEEVVVNNTFIKVLKPRRNPAEAGSIDAGYFQRTITYREYVHYGSAFGIALELSPQVDTERLIGWLCCINYLGKRGGFVQIQVLPQELETLPSDYLVIGELLQSFGLGEYLTQLDDVGEGLTFSRANIYSDEKITLGKQRVLHHVALPYRLVSSSRAYSHYRRE
jgi:hypothetical protein